MTLRNKIITALMAIGITAGYTIGGLDIECMKAENVIDIQDVRLCVSDDQLAKIKADDVLSIIANDIETKDVPRIVELAKVDPDQYTKVSSELIDKIDTDSNSQSLDTLHESLALEKPEYMQELKTALIAKYETNGGIKLDDYNIHMFMVKELLPPNSKLSGITGNNFMDKIISLIR